MKAEWQGYGDELPPSRSKTIFRVNPSDKNRVQYTKKQQMQLLESAKPLDVNDPRNEEILKKVRTLKNDYLSQLLDQDAKF